MSSLSIEGVTSTTAWIVISGVSQGDTIRVFVRLYDDPSDVTYNNEDLMASGSTFKVKIEGLEPDTHYITNYKVEDSGWLGDGSDDFQFTTKSENQRPWDWEWWSSIEQGGRIGLSAGEWNYFTSRVNEFLRYQDISEYDFTYVSKGDPISASIVNEARSAIMRLSGYDSGLLPSSARRGQEITANFFAGLKNALNSVP